MESRRDLPERSVSLLQDGGELYRQQESGGAGSWSGGWNLPGAPGLEGGAFLELLVWRVEPSWSSSDVDLGGAEALR